MDHAGSIAGEYLLGCGRRSIEIFVLTHMDEDHVDGAVRLMEMVPVNTLILPAVEEDDNGYKSAILACASRHGTEVRALENNAEATCGRLKVQLYRLSDSGDRNESGLMASLCVGETKLLVTADASKKLERKLVQQEDLSGTDILVV